MNTKNILLGTLNTKKEQGVKYSYSQSPNDNQYIIGLDMIGNGKYQ